jgi:hypothetical protein
MSYEIVKGIKFKKDVQEVWVKASSSNVEPKTYDWEEIKYFSDLWKLKGIEYVERMIIRDYWDCNYQPGVENNLSRAAELCYHLHPEINYSNVGKVKNVHLLDCPLEDLPKYLNIEDRVGQEIIRLRLAGEAVDPEMRGITHHTNQELSDLLYGIYKGYSKRVKGKFYKPYTKRGYLVKASSRRVWYHPDIEKAKCFKSEEDAIIYCRRHHLAADNIINEEK